MYEELESPMVAAAGLHEGDREALAIAAGDVPGYEGDEGIARAQAECVRGYRRELAAQ